MRGFTEDTGSQRNKGTDVTDWLDQLKTAVAQAGDQPLVWQSTHPSTLADGASPPKLLVLPKAARLMACQLPGVTGNLFFHHPQMLDHHQTAQLLAAGGGVGGDRLWIAPESAFMWKNLAAIRHDLAAHAHTPPAMDPAQYQIVSQSAHHIQLASDMQLHDDRSGQSLTLHVTRQFEVIDAPPELPAAVHCMSFAIHNALTLIQGGEQTHAGCWDLLQLPPGGTLICPTMQRVALGDEVRSYYEPLGDHVRVSDDAVLFRVDAKKRIKMGLSPVHTTGRMGYYNRQNAAAGMSTLIVRSFLPCPGQSYVDLPVDDILQGRRSGGDALQAYNHNDPDMAFGEMEYHEPAVHQSHGPRTAGGRCVTHVLAGTDELIRQEGKRLLGVELVEV